MVAAEDHHLVVLKVSSGPQGLRKSFSANLMLNPTDRSKCVPPVQPGSFLKAGLLTYSAFPHVHVSLWLNIQNGLS